MTYSYWIDDNSGAMDTFIEYSSGTDVKGVDWAFLPSTTDEGWQKCDWCGHKVIPEKPVKKCPHCGGALD
jgi:rubrerythrin